MLVDGVADQAAGFLDMPDGKRLQLTLQTEVLGDDFRRAIAAGFQHSLAQIENRPAAVAHPYQLPYLCYRINNTQQGKIDRLVGGLTHQQDVQVHRQEFGRRLTNILDMAEGETESSRSWNGPSTPPFPTPPSSCSWPTTATPTCYEWPPRHQPEHRPGAASTHQTTAPRPGEHKSNASITGTTSTPAPNYAADPTPPSPPLCVPVSITGRTVGVIHATGQPHTTIAEDNVADLGTLANLAGAQIDLLRLMAETQLQAATDSLTGLLNRCSFEQSHRRPNPHHRCRRPSRDESAASRSGRLKAAA
jgi:hypothetical protein